MRKFVAVWPFCYFQDKNPSRMISLSCHEPVPSVHPFISSTQIKPRHQLIQTNRSDDHPQTNPDIAKDILRKILIDHFRKGELTPQISQIKPRHSPNLQNRPAHKCEAHPNIAGNLVREDFIRHFRTGG